MAGFSIWFLATGLDCLALYLLFPRLKDRFHQLLACSVSTLVMASLSYQLFYHALGLSELVVAVLYMAFIFFGLLALGRELLKENEKSARWLTRLLFCAILGLTVWLFDAAVSNIGFPDYHRRVHWILFTLESAVLAVAITNLFEGSRKLRIVSAGYAVIALSSYSFQITELYRGMSMLDVPIATLWILGQLLLVWALAL